MSSTKPGTPAQSGESVERILGVWDMDVGQYTAYLHTYMLIPF